MKRFGKNSCSKNIFLLLFTIVVIPLHAQLYNFRDYSLDEGLSQSEVNCIYKDSRGYLWIGTLGGGLNRFDGNEFKIYDVKDGLPSQIITAISEDENHNLLIGTPLDALYTFNGKTFKKKDFSFNKYIKKGAITFITSDDHRNTIIGKSHQLLISNKKQFDVLPVTGDPLSDYTINCYKKDSRNILWIGTSKGLLVLKNKTLVKINDTNYINTSNVTALTEDINGNIWAVENNTQLYKIKIVGPSHYQVTVSKVDYLIFPEQTVISAIHFDKQNQLWISSRNKGVFRFAHNKLNNYNQTSGLPADDIKTIFEDSAANLWFGTAGGGLVKYTNEAFTYFDNVEGLREKDIFSICPDKAGNIWIGTDLHGLYKFDGITVTNETKASGIEDASVGCIYADKTGNLWIGTTKKLIWYNGKFHTSSIPGCENIHAIYEDISGNIWIGTRGNGVFLFDGKSFKQLTIKDGLTNETVHCFAQDKTGKIWMGTDNGIFVYINGKVTKQYGTHNSLFNSHVVCMTIDKTGNIWVGTAENGIAQFNGTTFKNITIKEGLASGTVYLMNTDNYGNIWVGTNKGLDKITLKNNGDILAIRNYGKDDGFKGIECNSRATCLDANGCLWFGTIKGVTKFDPKEELLRQQESPQIHIAGIKLFYENSDFEKYCDTLSHWYNLPDNLILPNNKNHITFDFKAISVTSPYNIKYSFKLEGFDKSWSPPSEINSATYSNLPPNKYKFLVKAFNKDGISSKTNAEFIFTITPPFWTTWWFITICIFSFMGIIYGYNEYRKHKHILYLERLEKIIKERTVEIIKQRDQNQILLKEVHHRVKNNLQIINSLINIQSGYVDNKKATELFREIRNRIRTISLVHEKLYKSDDYSNINVKEYIHMLIDNLIETYHLDKNIDLKLDLEVQYFNLNTIIPLGLLLNEILSNSFKYAFDETENGLIEIVLHASANSEELTIIIGDNGKGFDDVLFKVENTSLGLELVKILAGQLNGTIEKIQKPGTYYILKFKSLKD